MIGDDWDVDVMGAVNFGIDAVHFNRTLQNPNKINFHTGTSTKTYEISFIIQLNNIL